MDAKAKITPTFLLKGISPKILLEKYLAEQFPNREKKKISISKSSCILLSPYTDCNNTGVFYLKDKHNSKLIVATSGHENVQVYNKNGEYPPVGGRCRSCMCDFTHTSIGYPIAYQEMTLLVDEEKGGPPVYKIIHKFWTEAIFCSFECALYHIKSFTQNRSNTFGTYMQDSERYLKLLYRITYPDEKMVTCSKDPLLLISNGGSLTREQWMDKTHNYIRSHKILLLPSKMEYNRSEYKNVISIENGM